MQVVVQFDPSVTEATAQGPGGQFTVPASNGSNRLVVANESNISLLLYFPNSYSAYIPAWTSRLFCMSLSGAPIVWVQEQILASANAPISQVYIETYAPGESVPEVYPASLFRQTVVGNPIPVSTSATSIQNDSNVAGTSIVEATVSGDGSSAVSIKNNGLVTLGNSSRDGSIDLSYATLIAHAVTILDTLGFDTYLRSSGAGNLVHIDAGDGTEIANFGKSSGLILSVGHLGTVTAGDLLDTNGTQCYLKAPSAVNFQVPNGTNVAHMDGNGIHLDTGNYHFLAGQMTRVSAFSGTGTGTYNHGLGATPSIVLLVPHVNGSQTMGYDSENGTNVHITCGTGLSFNAFCIQY